MRCPLKAGLYSSVSVQCSSPAGLYSCVTVCCPSPAGLYSSNGRWHAIIILGMWQWSPGCDCSMIQAAGGSHAIKDSISIEVDPYQGLLPSTVEYQSPPSSDTGRDKACRYTNIQNPTDSYMHPCNLVHTVCWYSYHIVASAGKHYFVVVVVYSILFVAWFVFVMWFYSNQFYNFVTGTRQHKQIHAFFS